MASEDILRNITEFNKILHNTFEMMRTLTHKLARWQGECSVTDTRWLESSLQSHECHVIWQCVICYVAMLTWNEQMMT